MVRFIGINNVFENEEERSNVKINFCNFNVVLIFGRFNSIVWKISCIF